MEQPGTIQGKSGEKTLPGQESGPFRVDGQAVRLDRKADIQILPVMRLYRLDEESVEVQSRKRGFAALESK